MPDIPDNETHRQKRLEERGRRTVARFQSSAKGFRRVFGEHFPDGHGEVEALAYHLAQLEANLPNAREAIRLARYPGAGDRNPRRMALGLWENLSVLRRHVRNSIESLESLVGTEPDDEEFDEDELQAVEAEE